MIQTSRKTVHRLTWYTQMMFAANNCIFAGCLRRLWRVIQLKATQKSVLITCMKGLSWFRFDPFYPVFGASHEHIPAEWSWCLWPGLQVRGIEKCVLIISMDGLFSDIFDLVLSVDFCPVRVLLHPILGEEIGKIGGRGNDGVIVVKRHWKWLLSQVSVCAWKHSKASLFCFRRLLLLPLILGAQIERLRWGEERGFYSGQETIRDGLLMMFASYFNPAYCWLHLFVPS